MNELRILGKVYRIKRVQTPPGYDNVAIFGTCNHAQATITIDDSQGLQQEFDTLLHEALHALDFAMHLELEERQIHALGAGLAALFADNPGLAFWLSGHLVEITDGGEPAKKPAKKKKATSRRGR